MYAVVQGVKMLGNANAWHNVHIRIRTDASVVVPYVNKQGGRRPALHRLAVRLHHWCLRHHVLLSARHLAGTLNVTADALSRPQTRYGEHRLDPALWRAWFPKEPPLDLFATALTTQSPRYFSRVRDPRAAGVDAMSTPWPAGTLYAFPPLPLLLPLVSSLSLRLKPGARLMLVTPAWVSAPWYPLLREQAPRPMRLPAHVVQGQPSWPWSVLIWRLRA